MSSSKSGPTARTPLEAAEARAQLSQMLSVSLNVSDVISHFFQHIQPLIQVGGLRYLRPDIRSEQGEGKPGSHKHNFHLSCSDYQLGDITFFRDDPFTNTELVEMKALVALLIHPLCNALLYEQALAQALLDSLTGVGNRAAMDNALRRELQLAERYQQPLSLLVIDVDHFKRINDQYGHTHGDLVLKEISQTIQQVCRTSDMVFRYGGEEFVVLLSKTEQEGAITIAERLRNTIRQEPFVVDGGEMALTVSIGVSTRRSYPKDHAESLFERADRALYRAKANGRNCVVSADENSTQTLS